MLMTMADASSDFQAGFPELCKQAREVERNAISSKPSRLSGSLHPGETDAIFPAEFESYTFAYVFSEAQRVERSHSEKAYSSAPFRQEKAAIAPPPPPPPPSDGAYPEIAEELRRFAKTQPQSALAEAAPKKTVQAPDSNPAGAQEMAVPIPPAELGPSPGSSPPKIPFLPFGKGKSKAEAPLEAPSPPAEDIWDTAPYEVQEAEKEAAKEGKPLPFEENEEAKVAPSAEFSGGSDEAKVPESSEISLVQPSRQSKISPRLRAIIEEKLRKEEERRRQEQEENTDIERPPEQKPESAQDEVVFSSRERLLKKLQSQGIKVPTLAEQVASNLKESARQGALREKEAQAQEEEQAQGREEPPAPLPPAKTKPAIPSGKPYLDAAAPSGTAKLAGAQQANPEPKPKMPLPMAGEEGGGVESGDSSLQDEPVSAEEAASTEPAALPEKPIGMPLQRQAAGLKPSITIRPIFQGERESDAPSTGPETNEEKTRQMRLQRIIDELSDDRRASPSPRKAAGAAFAKPKNETPAENWAESQAEEGQADGPEEQADAEDAPAAPVAAKAPKGAKKPPAPISKQKRQAKKPAAQAVLLQKARASPNSKSRIKPEKAAPQSSASARMRKVALQEEMAVPGEEAAEENQPAPARVLPRRAPPAMKKEADEESEEQVRAVQRKESPLSSDREDGVDGEAPRMPMRVLPRRAPAQPQKREESGEGKGAQPANEAGEGAPPARSRVLPPRGLAPRAETLQSTGSKRIFPGGISRASTLQNTYIPPARQKIARKMPVRAEEALSEDEAPEPEEAPDSGQSAEPPTLLAKRALPSRQARKPEAVEEEKEEERIPDAPLPGSPVISAPMKTRDIAGEAKLPEHEDEEELAPPPPPPEDDLPVPVASEYEQAKDDFRAKMKEEGIKESAKAESEDATEQYAKENMTWLYEIYKMGGMSREDFLQKVRDKIAESKGSSPQGGQAEASNPAFASIGKEIVEK